MNFIPGGRGVLVRKKSRTNPMREGKKKKKKKADSTRKARGRNRPAPGKAKGGGGRCPEKAGVSYLRQSLARKAVELMVGAFTRRSQGAYSWKGRQGEKLTPNCRCSQVEAAGPRALF